MADVQPGMINKDYFQIFITHIPTEATVNFNAWVTGFTDNFTSTWKGTPAYGRMDDLYTFQKTARTISLAFDVVASDGFESAKNIRKLNALTQFLYPVYSEAVGDLGISANSQVLQAAPLLKMKWNGLISNAVDGADLVGFLRGFSYAPNLDAGQFFIPGRGSGKPFIAYQSHRVQLEYTVLHTHLTGWAMRESSEGGFSQYVFGGDPARDLGATYPHAISDPMVLAQGADNAINPDDPAGDVDLDELAAPAVEVIELPADGQAGQPPIEISAGQNGSVLGGSLPDAVLPIDPTDPLFGGGIP